MLQDVQNMLQHNALDGICYCELSQSKVHPAENIKAFTLSFLTLQYFAQVEEESLTQPLSMFFQCASFDLFSFSVFLILDVD